MSDFSAHPAYSKLYPAPAADEPPAFFPRKIARDDSAHLDVIEAQSIFIIREAFHHFKNICMPWSMGKDSNVLIWLSKKAFLGHIPYPLLHIDTTHSRRHQNNHLQLRFHAHLDAILPHQTDGGQQQE